MCCLQIDVISSSTLKIRLTQEDLAYFDITFEKLDRSDESTKSLLTALMEEAKRQKDFEFEDGKLFVEAFEDNDGGCVIYISAIGLPAPAGKERTVSRTKYRQRIEKKPAKLPAQKIFVLESTGFCQLYETAEKLRRHSEQIVSSSLYYNEETGRYRLVLGCRGVLPESCAQGSTAGDIIAGVTAEHDHCLLEENALEIITAREMP